MMVVPRSEKICDSVTQSDIKWNHADYNFLNIMLHTADNSYTALNLDQRV